MATERPHRRSRPNTARPAVKPADRNPNPVVHATNRNHSDEGRLMVGPSLLHMGTQALTRALRFDTPADMVLRSFFREHPKLGRRDRGYIAEATFAVLRRLNGYTMLAGGRNPRRLFILGLCARDAAGLGAHAIAMTQEERTWLDQATACDLSDAPLHVRAELPAWIIEALRETLDEPGILALGLGMQSPAPLDLRVNALRSSRDEAARSLAASGIEAAPTALSPVGLRVVGKPALEKHPLFLSGAVEVQDEGSQLLACLVAPRRREMVVDFCAGAGGKTMHLGALMRSEGRLYAFDVSAARLQRLRTRVARAGLSNVQPEALTSESDVRLKRLAGKIDRVLVDAPCTGFGTLRRNPDLKWRQQPADLAALCEKQQRILEAAARLLKPGGRLVYATCSVLPAENDMVVDAFLRTHADFRELDCRALLAQQDIAVTSQPRLRLLPHRDGTDAFFAATLERLPAPANRA